jgi:hypothetical protein
MFGADGLLVADGGQVEFSIPLQQFALIGDQSHQLSAGQVYTERGERRVGQVFHVI